MNAERPLLHLLEGGRQQAQERTPHAARIAVVLRSRTLRPLVEAVLSGAGYDIVHCPTIDALMSSHESGIQAALVDWSMTAGLLTEERRAEMQALAARLPMVLIVPRGWGRHLSAADLRVAIMLEKPFDADAMLDAVQRCVGGAQTARVGESDPRS